MRRARKRGRSALDQGSGYGQGDDAQLHKDDPATLRHKHDHDGACPGGRCQASGEASVSTISRSRTPDRLVTCENFLYVFKGARSAPGPSRPPIMEAPRAEHADPQHGVEPSGTWSPSPEGAVTRRAPPADLRPSGPRRRRRALSPRGRTTRTSRRRGQRWRASCMRWPSLRRPILKPCVLTVKGAPNGASQAIPSGPWTAPPAGMQRRLSEGWAGPSFTRRPSLYLQSTLEVDTEIFF
jgi:hypothetical protein